MNSVDMDSSVGTSGKAVKITPDRQWKRQKENRITAILEEARGNQLELGEYCLKREFIVWQYCSSVTFSPPR